MWTNCIAAVAADAEKALSRYCAPAPVDSDSAGDALDAIERALTYTVRPALACMTGLSEAYPSPDKPGDPDRIMARLWELQGAAAVDTTSPATKAALRDAMQLVLAFNAGYNSIEALSATIMDAERRAGRSTRVAAAMLEDMIKPLVGSLNYTLTLTTRLDTASWLQCVDIIAAALHAALTSGVAYAQVVTAAAGPEFTYYIGELRRTLTAPVVDLSALVELISMTETAMYATG